MCFCSQQQGTWLYVVKVPWFAQALCFSKGLPKGSAACGSKEHLLSRDRCLLDWGLQWDRSRPAGKQHLRVMGRNKATRFYSGSDKASPQTGKNGEIIQSVKFE